MKALVLAAGFGTRFRPVTNSLPKPMIPLCNRPLLAWAIEPLLDEGVDEIIINLHHLPDAIRTFATAEYGDRAKISFSMEEEILGTGGAIRRLSSQLASEPMFFLVNADTLQRPPLGEIRDVLLESEAVACLVLRHPPAGDRYTAVFFEDGYVSGFGSGSGEALMFSGSHALRGEIVKLLPDRPFSGITEDVYLPLVRQQPHALAGVVHDGLWFDIGTPQRYQSASSEILSLCASGRVAVPTGSRLASGDSLVHERAAVDGDLQRSIVGAGSEIGSGARLVNAVVWERCFVPAGALITNSVLAHDVRLDEPLNVENAIVSNAAEGEVPEGTITHGQFTFSPIDSSRPVVAQRHM